MWRKVWGSVLGYGGGGREVRRNVWRYEDVDGCGSVGNLWRKVWRSVLGCGGGELWRKCREVCGVWGSVGDVGEV